MSRAKKAILIVLGIIVTITIAVVGVGAKVYVDMSDSVQKTYESVERQLDEENKKREKEVDISKKEPFSVLLLGVDTGELGRTDQGRSDSMMVVTVNPEKKKTTVVSIPRDTYVEIVGKNKQDKINHAYAFGGAGMSMDTVEKFLDIPIDHYVSINLKGIEQLVDALGGIDVSNDMEFTNLGHTYNYGKISLNGDEVLGFTNMRKKDPRGDYGRQERHRKVLEGIAKKVLTLDGVTKYKELLDAMEDNVKTDMSFDTMKTIGLDYRDAFRNLQQDQLQGDGFMQDGISYQRVNNDELVRVQNELKEQLKIRN